MRKAVFEELGMTFIDYKIFRNSEGQIQFDHQAPIDSDTFTSRKLRARPPIFFAPPASCEPKDGSSSGPWTKINQPKRTI